MAFQINTGLTTQDGGTVASGAYVIMSVNFPFTGLRYGAEFKIYRSLQAFNDGLQSIRVNEIEQPFFTKNLTQEEYAALTPITIQNDAKAYLETLVGSGNVSIV